MARTVLVPQPLASHGLNPSSVNGDNANGHSYPARPGRFLRIKNTAAGTLNVTIRQGPGATQDGTAPADLVIVVPANTGDTLIGPMPANYTQADGNVYVDLAAGGATVQVMVLDVNG